MNEPSWEQLLGHVPLTCPRCGRAAYDGLRKLLGAQVCVDCAREVVVHRDGVTFIASLRAPRGARRRPAPAPAPESVDTSTPEPERECTSDLEPAGSLAPGSRPPRAQPAPLDSSPDLPAVVSDQAPNSATTGTDTVVRWSRPPRGIDYGLGKPGPGDLSWWIRLVKPRPAVPRL